MISIRAYRAEDFDELWRIDQKCFARGIAYSREELGSYIRHSRAFTLVAEQGEKEKQTIAFIVAESDKTGIGHILTIDVLPEFQRTKIGSRLLAAAEKKLREERCRSVLLEVAVNNLPALTFYKRHGYSVIQTIPRYYLDSIDALVMGKRLTTTSKA